MISAEEIRNSIKKVEERIELADAVKRLQHNQDFKKVFTNHIFNARVLELVNDIHSYKRESVEHIDTIEELESISRTQAYLNYLIDKGQWAENDLRDIKSIPDSEII